VVEGAQPRSAAQAAGDLRRRATGRGTNARIHRETTKYRGTHYIEAYVVIDGTVVASD